MLIYGLLDRRRTIDLNIGRSRETRVVWPYSKAACEYFTYTRVGEKRHDRPNPLPHLAIVEAESHFLGNATTLGNRWPLLRSVKPEPTRSPRCEEILLTAALRPTPYRQSFA